MPTGYAYAGAVSVLKALKVVPGERFRPTEEATLRELVGMLGCFYPLLSDAELVMDDGTGDGQSPRYRFADLSQSDPDYRLFCTAVSLGWLDDDPEQPLEPDKPLTRARCAALINRVMGRGTGLEVDESIAGKVADVPPDHPYYTDLMEAVVPHSYAMEGGKERWSDSEPFASKLGEGLLFVGPQMYCVGADGYLLLDESWHGFDFGPDGRYTSGNEELDDLVREALGDILTPGMTGDQKLRAAYDYTVHSFTYTKGEHHERGDVSWAEDAAIEMLSQGHSNCYGYAAVFYQMARALGRDAALVSGLYGENYVYHAWVEFEVDGTTYICDPEIEMTYVREGLEDNVDMFMMLPGYADIFGYTK